MRKCAVHSQVDKLSDEEGRKQLEYSIDALIERSAGPGRTHMDYKDFVVLLGLDTKATGRWVFKKSDVKKTDLSKVSFILWYIYTRAGTPARRACVCRGGVCGRPSSHKPTT